MNRTLEVWCFGRLAGLLVDDGEALSFTYDEKWMVGGYPPLSQALPLRKENSERQVKAFFGGLLPEGDLRKMLARELGVSDENDFSILEHVGGDCAGAVSLYLPGKAPGASRGRVDWLDDAQVANLVKELPDRPMYAAPDDEYRLSLAGAQDKLPVVLGEGQRIGIPRDGEPSTHILKTPIAGLPATVLNEAFCLRLGAELGISVAPAEPRKVSGEAMLLVKRYDRSEVDEKTTRLHQEDFCQALGIESYRKYESEGGPTLLNCVQLLRDVSKTPAADLPRFLDAWALSFLAGNHDAHGKNYSLLYDPGGPSLAPAYDVLCTIVYRRRHLKKMDKKMAMKVGGQRYAERLTKDQLERFLEDAGYGLAPSRRRLRALADRAPEAARKISEEFKNRYWWDSILDDVVTIVGERASRLSKCVEVA